MINYNELICDNFENYEEGEFLESSNEQNDLIVLLFAEAVFLRAGWEHAIVDSSCTPPAFFGFPRFSEVNVPPGYKTETKTVQILEKGKWYPAEYASEPYSKELLFGTSEGKIEQYKYLTCDVPNHPFFASIFIYEGYGKYLIFNDEWNEPKEIEISQPFEAERGWFLLNSKHELIGPKNSIQAIDEAYYCPEEEVF